MLSAGREIQTVTVGDGKRGKENVGTDFWFSQNQNFPLSPKIVPGARGPGPSKLVNLPVYSCIKNFRCQILIFWWTNRIPTRSIIWKTIHSSWNKHESVVHTFLHTSHYFRHSLQLQSWELISRKNSRRQTHLKSVPMVSSKSALEEAQASLAPILPRNSWQR